MPRKYFWTATFLLFFVPSLLSAQTPPPVTIDFYGTIDANPPGTLIVNGRVVDIRTAQMNGLLLAPGLTVHIQADYAPDGTLVARQLEVVPVGLIPGLVELSGVVDELSDTTLRIGSQLIDLSVAQQIGTIAVGQPVQVFASATNSSQWNARLVLGTDAAAAPVIVSPVSTPEVAPPNDAPVVVQPVTTPEVGAPDDAPVIVAPVSTPEVVPPATTPEVSDDFRIEGTLEAVGSNAVIVDGQIYDISSARIDDPLRVGAFVRMEVRIVNGVPVVERIRIEDD